MVFCTDDRRSCVALSWHPSVSREGLHRAPERAEARRVIGQMQFNNQGDSLPQKRTVELATYVDEALAEVKYQLSEAVQPG